MAFFGTIMAEINLMVEKGKSYEQHIEEVEEDFELWRFKLDNVIPDKRIPRYLYKQISHAMEATLDHNFRMVFYDYPFFGHMAPRIQAEVNSIYIYVYIYIYIICVLVMRIHFCRPSEDL